MARAGNAFVKWQDNVTPRLNLIGPNLMAAAEAGTYRVASQAVQVIRRRVESAETETGRRRVAGLPPRFKPRPAWFLGRGPGRVESGALLDSVRWTQRVGRDRVTATGGFINAPRYLAQQELGTPGPRGIPEMGAYALGHTKVAATFEPVMSALANRALRAAQRGSVFKDGSL